MMYNINEINLKSKLGECEIMPRKKGVRAKGDKRNYINIISCFDIETTRIPSIDNSVMYIWQWHFYNLKEHKPIITVYGRTWYEYLDTCKMIKEWINDNIPFNGTPSYMVRLIHNLAYEFQFLSGIYPYTEKEVFAMKKRRVVKADSFECIEDRCTYIHSNMSLDKYAKEWGASHKKLIGEEFDYDKQRFSWTPMTQKELDYCECDVLSCTEAYVNEMDYYNDNLYTIPLLQRDM